MIKSLAPHSYGAYPQFLGILNLTPNSYSDGYSCLDEALAQFHHLRAEGADIIDIGAEATNPEADLISPKEEQCRLLPFLNAIADQSTPPLSLDSRNTSTHKMFAKHFKISYINDITGFHDLALIDLVGELNIKAIVMHSFSVPPTQDYVLPLDKPAIASLLNWAEATIQRLKQRGLEQQQIILDPGIGFGKTPQQSLNILQNIGQLKQLGCPILVGHSRKSFMNLWTSAAFEKRDLETALLTTYLTEKGVDYFRVHNIGYSRRALQTKKAFSHAC